MDPRYSLLEYSRADEEISRERKDPRATRRWCRVAQAADLFSRCEDKSTTEQTETTEKNTFALLCELCSESPVGLPVLLST
jgi:NADH:ubiquinone oxidoreductase subunit E